MTKRGAFKLIFDAARCDGRGMCTVVYPEGISLDPWGFARVTGETVTDDRMQRKALRAVACCPRGALSASFGEGVAAPPTAPARQEPQ